MGEAPPRLTGVTELMELPGQDPRELEACLRDLERVNRLFGGHRVVLKRLPRLVEGLPEPVRILDVAAGGADVPRAIVLWARRHGLAVEIEAVDRNADIVRIAARAGAAFPEIHLRAADGLALPYPDGSFDIVLASLVLHHLEGDAPERLLREIHRVARRAVIVNDIRRGRWPWLVTWIALHAVSGNRFIRHDGPLSVRRGFLPEELLALGAKAGWPHARLTRHAFFRLALVGEKAQPGGQPASQPSSGRP